MKSVLHRLVCFLLVLALFPLYLGQSAIPARAAFENTYVNTGDQRADLIGVALTQVGYREGSNNYTKYGVWFGHSNMAWCGAFVSWCANQAGIPTSVLKKNGFASASGFGIPSYTVYDHVPRPGDLFFKNNGGHTGIVYYVEGDYFYTLEGNTYEGPTYEDGVYMRKRYLYGEYYFGAPNYQSDGSHNYQQHYESQHPHKEYYQCTDCGAKYYTGKTSTVSDCKECLMASCSHQYGSYASSDSSYHSATCTLCGKQSYLLHTWGNDKVITAATCKSTGVKEQSCTLCGATRKVDIPKTDDHQFGDWIYMDNENHYRICESCNEEVKSEHTVSQWESDPFEHWYQCELCMGLAGMEEHDFPEDNCEAACATCGYVLPGGHLFSEDWEADQAAHWHSCENCALTADRQEHTYSAQCDESCDVCGHLRQTVHTFSTTYTGDETGHWHSCQVCGQPEEILLHTPGPEATDSTGQYCTVCNFLLVPALVHEHCAQPYEFDSHTHWGVCGCGEVLEKEVHRWNVSTGKCDVCGAPLPEITEDPIPWQVIGISSGAAAVMLGVAGTVLGILLRRRRARRLLGV